MLQLHSPVNSAAGEPASGKIKIGIYDSRAVAIAFTGSDAFKQWIDPIKAENEKAKKAGDSERLKKIDEQMRATQKLRHKQAFSTAPVDDLLKYIEGSLAGIKQEAGVEALVSKWDEPALQPFKAAQRIDVTARLVEAFHPTERQRKSALEIQKHKPIPLAEAEKFSD